MKRFTIYIAAALVAALALCAMAGCSSQSASSASASDASASASASAKASASASAEASDSASASAEASDSASASAAAEQSQEELVTEFKKAMDSTPEFKSVTVIAEESTTYKDTDSGEDEDLTATTIYKFDTSGEKIRTSAEAEISDIKLTYFTEGDDVVLVTDGPSYSGTAEQFDLAFTGGLGAFLDDSVGEIDTIVDCVATVEKLESNGLTFYTLTLDPEKYIASDEALQILADAGSPVKEAIITFGFEEDGSLCSLDDMVAYEDSALVKNMMFSDYDSTVIDPMPEADKTYEEMEADMQEKLGALSEEIEKEELLENEEGSEEGSSDAAEAK